MDWDAQRVKCGNEINVHYFLILEMRLTNSSKAYQTKNLTNFNYHGPIDLSEDSCWLLK